MYYRNLPKDIQIIAEKRFREAGRTYDIKESDSIGSMFGWNKTPEDYFIWSDVSAGKYGSFYKFHKMHESIDNYSII